MKRAYLFLIVVLLNGILLAQNKPTYHIGLLIDNLSSEVEPIILEMQNEIKAVVGEDATIVFLPYNKTTNNFDVQKVRANYNSLIEGKADIILAFGTISNVIVGQQEEHVKPTILFGAVNSDVIKIDKTRTTSGIHNFNFLVTSQSYSRDLKTFKEIVDFKNVAVLVEDFLPDLVSIEATLDKEVAALNASYKLIPFQNIDDIKSNLQGVDAVYMAGGFFLNDSEIEDLSNFFIENNLPSFTATHVDDVAKGLMATNQSEENLSRFFRRIALNVEAIVNGVDASELSVYIDYNNKLTINYNTAEQVGVPIRYSLIATTNFVGDYKKVVAEKKYNLLEVINQTVNNNLSLQSEKQKVALKEQDVKDAKSNYLPELSASATGTYLDPDLAEISGGQNPEYRTSGNISLTQTLYSEAATANIKIQSHLQKAEQENYNAAELDAVLNASTAYFNTLILKANTLIQSENLEVTKRNLEIAQQNYDAGEAGKMDVLRFRSELAQNTQAFVEAVNQLDQARFALNAVLNNPINFKLDVDEAELSKGIFENYNYEQLGELIDDPSLRKQFVNFLVQEAKQNSPEIAALDYNLKATERTLKLNSSGRFVPTLALQGQYNRDFNQWGKGSIPEPALDDNYNLALNLSIPIFKQNKQNINKQIAEIQKEQLDINKDNFELNIERNINEAVLDIINQIANIELSKISERTAKESLDLVQVSYSNGAVPIVQLIDAQRNYLQAQQSKANATYNYLLSSMQLERYLGQFFLLNTEAENQDFIRRFNAFLLTNN
ncbi:TolC family protein [Pontimicrobium sp. IMCC45349]|uniref:TolC family protein n=1 Tax=Pontimicrobium sp. IMCC45349 TaxID=3391574 RepID=UPI0039A0294F